MRIEEIVSGKLEGKEVDGLAAKLNAFKAEFVTDSNVFIVTGGNYTSTEDTTLMTFKCSVNEGTTGNKEVKFFIDDDNGKNVKDTNAEFTVDENGKAKITIDFSPKSAIAPLFLAKFISIISTFALAPAWIWSFTNFSIWANSSLLTGFGWLKSNLNLSASTLLPA